MKLSPLQRIAIHAIRLYQRTLSPDTGWWSYRYPYGVCRFTPTCSAYAADAIRSHGLIRGSALAFRRILRCHPWQVGGFDPVKK